MVALIDKNGQHAHKAGVLFSAWEAAQADAILLDLVANETLSVLCRKAWEGGRKGAEWSGFYRDYRTAIAELGIVWTFADGERLFWDTVDLVEQQAGRLNFHDALIALLVRERGLTHLASFDRAFDDLPWLRRVATPADVTAAASG